MMTRFLQLLLTATLVCLSLSEAVLGQSVLVEAESFDSHGGWKLDTQFIENMGSPYLLAHGLGEPVQNAETIVKFEELGDYHVFVRTKDWVAKWDAPGSPGKFQVLIDDQPLPESFGTRNAEWDWQYGGKVSIRNQQSRLALADLTGFDGRCDAVYFSKVKVAPPKSSDVLPGWRRKLLGHPDEIQTLAEYDLVVIGGGYSGLGTALSAARSGCRVALIQNRPVLGGNGSSEVRVWSMGLIRRGKYPRIGEIVEEFCDHATKSPGTYEEFGDAKKEKIVRDEPNIDLFLSHHVFQVEKSGDAISFVHAMDTRTSEVKKFGGKLFCDCTGHGSVGYLANADYEMTPKGRMGMSNMWAWAEGEEPKKFPKTPWALDLELEDFPYPRDFHGQWFWESGFDKDPIKEAEAIRDWNLRAVFGAFNAMKNRGGADKHKNAKLTWVAFVGGPRESRRLLGDVVLTQEDVVGKKEFKDGCVPSTWSIDLHYPKKQYAKKFADNPFISIAEHDRRIDRAYGYPVPYRCFYSRKVDNLFMAGRCISVTHEALGTTRVMKTCGMMGEVVGRAASVCIKHDCKPRAVYEKYWPEMDELLKLPGKARRNGVHDDFLIPKDSMRLASSHGPMDGLDPAKLEGIVVDNWHAKKQGKWEQGKNLKGFVGWDYQYASPSTKATMKFSLKSPREGTYEVRVAYGSHKNRGTQVPILIATSKTETKVKLDMTKPANGAQGFQAIGKVELSKGEVCDVTLSTEDAQGVVHADAIQMVRIDK